MKYFTANTPFSQSAQRQDLYLRAVGRLKKVEIIRGKFKKRYVEIKKNYIKNLCVSKRNSESLQTIKDLLAENPVQFSKYEEKETDVNIATHIMYDCCKERIDSVVLVSNDTDLKLPLNFARQRLKRRVVVITPTKLQKGIINSMKAHQDLQKISNKTFSLTENHLKNNQFSNPIYGISKPTKWL